jgi:hypothetical protein
MKATITTKNGITVSGQVTFVGSHTIALDAKLTAKEVDELAKEEASISSNFLKSWHVNIPRRIIETYELAD